VRAFDDLVPGASTPGCKANSAAPRDAIRLTPIEKANAFDTDEADFLQVQSYSWSTTYDLGLDLIDVLRSKGPAQPNPRFALTRNAFNPQLHQFLAPERILLNATTRPFTIH
jgi:hypothetical protein